jgi:hypothetical protein
MHVGIANKRIGSELIFLIAAMTLSVICAYWASTIRMPSGLASTGDAGQVFLSGF